MTPDGTTYTRGSTWGYVVTIASFAGVTTAISTASVTNHPWLATEINDQRERELRRLRELCYDELARRKAIAAFPAFLDVAAEAVDISQPEPEPRVPTARRSGCRSRGRRPMRARPGRRRKILG